MPSLAGKELNNTWLSGQLLKWHRLISIPSIFHCAHSFPLTAWSANLTNIGSFTSCGATYVSKIPTPCHSPTMTNPYLQRVIIMPTQFTNLTLCTWRHALRNRIVFRLVHFRYTGGKRVVSSTAIADTTAAWNLRFQYISHRYQVVRRLGKFSESAPPTVWETKSTSCSITAAAPYNCSSSVRLRPYFLNQRRKCIDFRWDVYVCH